MTYTIHKLALLAGISTRALRYYDQIELLQPSSVMRNGYRVYDQQSLLRLQQILFFKELEFPLNEIKKILDNPNFDQVGALKDQRCLLELKQKRLQGLVKTINTTIKHMTNRTMPLDAELYDAFADEEMKQYADEAKKRWGNTEAYKQSQERTKHLTKADIKKIKEDGNIFTQKIADAMPKGPKDSEVQVLIAEHYKGINFFYECSLEMYQNLGQMYVDDSRFTAYYEKFAPGLAVFMKDAITFYCQKNKPD
jgi:DNA-binding transcriptional MerR regulator